MAGKYKAGDRVFMVVSNIYVRVAEVLRYAGGFYTIRFLDVPGGMRIREDRLFPSKEDAEATIKGKKLKNGRELR